MTQYCRYCAFCICGDVLYCTSKEMILDQKQICRVNHCKDFSLCPTGDVLTGRTYTPRKGKPIKHDEVEQLILRFDDE